MRCSPNYALPKLLRSFIGAASQESLPQDSAGATGPSTRLQVSFFCEQVDEPRRDSARSAKRGRLAEVLRAASGFATI